MIWTTRKIKIVTIPFNISLLRKVITSNIITYVSLTTRQILTEVQIMIFFSTKTECITLCINSSFSIFLWTFSHWILVIKENETRITLYILPSILIFQFLFKKHSKNLLCGYFYKLKLLLHSFYIFKK